MGNKEHITGADYTATLPDGRVNVGEAAVSGRIAGEVTNAEMAYAVREHVADQLGTTSDNVTVFNVRSSTIGRS